MEMAAKLERTRVELMPDIVYRVAVNHKGTPTPLKLSLLLPQTDAIKPVILYYPGGGFTEANYRKYIQIKVALAEAGYAVASVEYSVIPEAFPAGLMDAKAAVAYLRANAETYHLNPEKIGVFGQSAGGYMAQFVGVTSGSSAFLPAGMQPEAVAVQAVLSLFGVSDLLKMGEDFRSMTYGEPTSNEAVWVNGLSLSHSTNTALADEPKKALAASPIHYVRPGLPPFLLMHGDADQTVSFAQTDEMVQALKTAHVPVDQVTVKGAGHGTPEWIQPAVISVMVDWFLKHLPVA